MIVPYNRPTLWGKEIRYIRSAIRRGQISGDGYFTEQCSRWLEKRLAAPKVLLTPSGTHALELAALLLNLKPSDEFIVSSFTFPSTANAFVLRGAVPRFVDIRPDTLNIDERLVEAAVNRRTKVLVPMHYAGVPCDMTALNRLARKHRLKMVEDAAQALGARYRGRLAGTFGDLNAFSFHETKNIICGEGGALAIMDPRYSDRAEIIRQKGTNRAKFYRGEVDKYSWVDVGSSYVPSELQSAYLFAQLEKLDAVISLRRRLYERYREALQPLEDRGNLTLPVIPSGVTSSYHLFHILVGSQKARDRILTGLRRVGITSVFHYFPLHLSGMGRKFGYRRGQFPISEKTSACLLRLPLYNRMTSSEQAYVIRNFIKLV